MKGKILNSTRLGALWKQTSEVSAPFAVEFCGTFFLMVSIGFNSVFGSGTHPLAPFGIGLTLVVLVFAFGHISGAHFNPAVTVAVALSRRGKITVLSACLYIFVQLLGAFLGALFYWGITDKTFQIQPGSDINSGKAMVVEWFWTFLLATVVLQVATTTAQAGNSFFGIAIGFTVVAGAVSVGAVSGGAFNPAVATGAALVDAMHNSSGSRFKYLWIYWVGPLLGGAIAGLWFWFTNYPEFIDDEDVQREKASLFGQDQSLADRAAIRRDDHLHKLEERVERKVEEFAHIGYHPVRTDDSEDYTNPTRPSDE